MNGMLVAMGRVYSDKYGEVACDTAKGLVEVCWSTHCSGQPLRGLLIEALRHATSSRLTAWLCDMRKLRCLERADRDWLVRAFLPCLDKRGRQRVAFVVNLHNFEPMSGAQPQNVVGQDPGPAGSAATGLFLTKNEAEHWLLS